MSLTTDPPILLTGSAPSAGVTITPTSSGKHIREMNIVNLDAPKRDLLVSFDGGVNFFTIHSSLDVFAMFTSIVLKSSDSATATSYEIAYIIS